ncbi:extracellular solute-binding protein [Paenarthrobacter sp. NPDC091711]|uniref:extracellular solute-binding protein n=1 Tax=Micrococcaceae TaxID=1268 RepID=UPI00089D548F|nr:extracellular solute-binding protein [Arthrobacter sp. cf158]SDX50244.1 ABC-type Fe3+ transport system, substrate-binding protein [Arthrobacter sp. cf158]
MKRLLAYPAAVPAACAQSAKPSSDQAELSRLPDRRTTKSLTRRVAPFAAAVMAATLLSACSASDLNSVGSQGTSAGGQCAATDIAGVEEMAKKEGSLVLYTATHDGINKPEVAAFSEKYSGINVQVTRLAGGDLAARFASERAAGANSADIIKSSDNLMFEENSEWFSPINNSAVPNLSTLDDRWKEPVYFSTFAGPFVVTSNSKALTGKAPSTWKDLAAPEYAGKGGLADPRPSPAFLATYEELRELYGDDYLRTLGSSGYDFWESSSAAVQDLAAGVEPFIGPNQESHSSTLRKQGAPLQVNAISPSIGILHSVAVSSAAQHPCAAALYANFLLSHEGQTASCQGEYQSLIYGDIPNCRQVDPEMIVIDIAKGQKNKDQILSLLGLK